MRKTLTTVALLLALSCTAFGGEILIPPAPAPTPARATQEQTGNITLNGEIPTPGVTESLKRTVLELLAVLPSIL